jgi:hypothetical protein
VKEVERERERGTESEREREICHTSSLAVEVIFDDHVDSSCKHEQKGDF